MAVATADFVQALNGFPLLTPEQNAELPALQQQFPELMALARELIKRGWLTQFQVTRLCQGREGRLMLGPYILLDRLGEAETGAVYKARHRNSEQLVALKLICEERLNNPVAMNRLLNAVRAATRLDHANVAHVIDADQIDGMCTLATEYIEGTDLAVLLKKNGPLPTNTACEYIRQAALGLQHIHEQGLIHRDIKPSNLLLTDAAKGGGFGTVKVINLDQASVVSQAGEEFSTRLSDSATVRGTFDFVAPEQAKQSQNLDIRADLYGLGCTLYFLLTGIGPYSGDTGGEKRLKDRVDELVPVEQRCPDLPLGVAGVVRRLMAKRPEDRYQTPKELAAVLEVGLNAGQWPVPKATSAIQAVIPVMIQGRPALPPIAVGTNLVKKETRAASVIAKGRPASGIRLGRGRVILTIMAGALGVLPGLAMWFALRPRMIVFQPITGPAETQSEAFPRAFPKEIAEAWKQAGAEVGWLRLEKFENAQFLPEEQGVAGDLPAFLFFHPKNWEAGKLAALPAPTLPFGLELDVLEFGDADLEDLARLESLQWLALNRSSVSDRGLKAVAGLKNLRSLSLFQTRIGDTGLKELAGLKSLQTLELGSTPITDAGLKWLAGLKNLHRLDISARAVSDAGLKHVAGLSSLHTLLLAGTGVTDAGLKELAGMGGLQCLELAATDVGNAGLRELAGLKELRRLGLSFTAVSDSGLKQLAGLKNLERLYLQETKITSLGLDQLAGLTNMELLSLANTKVNDIGLKHLTGLHRLHTLYLGQTWVDDRALKEIGKLPSLQTLYLPYTGVTGAGLKYLAALKQLRTLNLNDTRVGDAGLKDLTGLQRLEALYLGWTQVGDAGLKELAELKNLQQLNLNRTKVTDAGLKHLVGLKNLQHLRLCDIPLTDAGLKDLAAMKSLRELVVLGTQVTNAGTKDLHRALPNCEITH